MDCVLIVAALLPLFLFAVRTRLLDNIWLLILFYTVMNLPIAIWMLRSFLAEVPKEMLEAAEVDGAGLIRTMREVVAPVVMPGIAAGFLMSFTLSIDDFVITFFVAGVGLTTLPLQIYSMIKVAVTPEVNAVSTLLMGLTLLLIALASRFAFQSLRRES